MRDLHASPALRARVAPDLPVARLVLGRKVEDAAALLPRLFNLCRVAQGVAARAAFGLPVDPDWQVALRHEIQRAHMAKLCLKWPALIGLAPVALPRDWMEGGAETRAALFGPGGTMPEDGAAFGAYLDQAHGVAPVLRAIARLFQPGEACRRAVRLSRSTTLFDAGAQENSVAARRAAHPVMQHIETSWGRGPLWLAAALAYDLEALFDRVVLVSRLATGRAVVPAARGLYGITADITDGRVTAFTRVTPTDHLLAPGGGLEQALATLSPEAAKTRAPLLLSILDPCSPVSLEPASAKEPAHA
ncbi:MAG: hydrogenase expression/formation protein HupK [Pseudomonadota bacterium]